MSVTLRKIDLDHIWHPFTPTSVWANDNAPIIRSGDGFYLLDVDGKRYLDGVSSIWCNVHGHSCKEIVKAITDQAERIGHSTLLGLTHEPAIELTEELLKLFPQKLNRVFYSDSGSAAVEGGLRMALEFWAKSSSEADRKRHRLLSVNTGYHGDTLGAVSVGFVDIFHEPLRRNLIPSLKFFPPHVYRLSEGLSIREAEEKSLKALSEILESSGDEVAAIIIEPLVQGAAGIWTHSPTFFGEVLKRARIAGTLIIVDEVATGFGKTGKMFAHEHSDITPDIVILGKSLSGGYLPLSAAVSGDHIFDRFTAPVEELKTFFYGQTFAGNPLACAAATANLRLIQQEKILDNLPEKIDVMSSLLNDYITPLKNVFEVRQQGLMIGIELTRSPGRFDPYPSAELTGHRIVQKARELGLFIRPIGNVIIMMPAIGMPIAEIKKLVALTAESISSVTNS
jgi:adenosylmethionine-8-amino-7-oxononanoate aminotransferase